MINIAAQLGTAATTGLGDERQQRPQAGHADRVNDVAAVAGRLRQAGAFQRIQVETEGGGRDFERGRDVASGHA